MRIVFTRNTSPLSRLIRWGFEEPVSHVGIVFKDVLLFHSNLLGVHVDNFKSYSNTNEIVYEIEYNLSDSEEIALFLNLYERYAGRGYDFKAFLYLACVGFRYKFLRHPLPDKNSWEDDRTDICLEMVEKLPASVIGNIPKELSMLTPYRLYKLLLEAKNG